MLKRKDLLGIQDISREDILEILDTAESFQEVCLPTLPAARQCERECFDSLLKMKSE